MQVRVSTALVLLATLAMLTVAAVPIKLHRPPHTFESNGLSQEANHKKIHGAGRKSVGRHIPMSGGILTLGAFFLDLTVGTGAGQQKFAVIVDTGSSNTAVPAVGCTRCATNQLYNASMSPTSRPLACSDPMCTNCIPIPVGSASVPSGDQKCQYGNAVCYNDMCGFGFAYGGGGTGTEGTIVTDVACLANGTYCARIYLDQLQNEFPTGTQSSGILGLAYGGVACNPTCQPPILDAMVANGTLPANEDLFGMCLTKANGGIMDLGALDTTRYTGTMKYTKVVSDSFFSIEVKDILIGNISIGVPRLFYKIHNDVLGSFVDSGTTVVLVGPYAMQRITDVMLENFPHLPHVDAIFGQGACVNFTNPNYVNLYPTISFVIEGLEGTNGDFTVSMDGTNYLLASGGTLYCPGIAGVPSIGVILGDVIMANYYIAFDRQNKKLGFADVQNCY